MRLVLITSESSRTMTLLSFARGLPEVDSVRDWSSTSLKELLKEWFCGISGDFESLEVSFGKAGVILVFFEVAVRHLFPRDIVMGVLHLTRISLNDSLEEDVFRAGLSWIRFFRVDFGAAGVSPSCAFLRRPRFLGDSSESFEDASWVKSFFLPLIVPEGFSGVSTKMLTGFGRLSEAQDNPDMALTSSDSLQ